MERNHVLEAGGAAFVCTLAAVGTFQVVAGVVDWVFVFGLGMCAGIAASANYQARVGHSEQVADEAPTVDYEPDDATAEAVDGE